MPLARCEFVVQDDRGNVVPGAEITVQAETAGAPLATIFSDRAGGVPLANPFTSSDGKVAFHVVGGAYRITATAGAFSATWRHKPIGTAQETDGGLPSGGDQGQLLAKASDNDYDTEWIDAPAGSGGRETLSADRTYYVRTNGNNANNGLTNTPGGAFLTIQRAIDAAAALDTSIYNVTITVAAGTYAEALALKSLLGPGKLSIIGDIATPTNVVVAPASGAAVTASGPMLCALRGLSLVASLTTTIAASAGARIEIGNLKFNASTLYHLSVLDGASVSVVATYTIGGNAYAHLYVGLGGRFSAGSLTITLTGSPAFGFAFAAAFLVGVIQFASTVFSGSATGARYNVYANGTIFTFGQSSTFLPGSSAGSTASGGQYA